MIAKTPDAKTNLGLQFFNKTTKRKYRALVWGTVEQDEGTTSVKAIIYKLFVLTKMSTFQYLMTTITLVVKQYVPEL